MLALSCCAHVERISARVAEADMKKVEQRCIAMRLKLAGLPYYAAMDILLTLYWTCHHDTLAVVLVPFEDGGSAESSAEGVHQHKCTCAACVEGDRCRPALQFRSKDWSYCWRLPTSMAVGAQARDWLLLWQNYCSSSHHFWLSYSPLQSSSSSLSLLSTFGPCRGTSAGLLYKSAGRTRFTAGVSPLHGFFKALSISLYHLNTI